MRKEGSESLKPSRNSRKVFKLQDALQRDEPEKEHEGIETNRREEGWRCQAVGYPVAERSCGNASGEKADRSHLEISSLQISVGVEARRPQISFQIDDAVGFQSDGMLQGPSVFRDDEVKPFQAGARNNLKIIQHRLLSLNSLV